MPRRAEVHLAAEIPDDDLAIVTPAHAQVARLNIAGFWEGNYYGAQSFTLHRTTIASGAHFYMETVLGFARAGIGAMGA
jgi:hypothetical protein